MAKLLILSDLHLEFAPFCMDASGADIVILAGDTHVGTKGLEWAKHTFPGKPVVYVLGNHEYYQQATPKNIASLKKLAQGSNVHILENDEITLDGIRFLGCTLWTDYALLGDPKIAGYAATERMSDFSQIRVSPQYRRIRALDVTSIHQASLSWLRDNLSQSDSTQNIVVTHHAPSPRSFSSDYSDEIMSAAYASNLDEFVASCKARLWIHGHIHSQSDYQLGDTRVICNPRGYPDEANPDFDPELIVEI